MMEQWLASHADLSLPIFLMISGLIWLANELRLERSAHRKDSAELLTLNRALVDKLLGVTERAIAAQSAATEVVRTLGKRFDGFEQAIERSEWHRWQSSGGPQSRKRE